MTVFISNVKSKLPLHIYILVSVLPLFQDLPSELASFADIEKIYFQRLSDDVGALYNSHVSHLAPVIGSNVHVGLKYRRQSGKELFTLHLHDYAYPKEIP